MEFLENKYLLIALTFGVFAVQEFAGKDGKSVVEPDSAHHDYSHRVFEDDGHQL